MRQYIHKIISHIIILLYFFAIKLIQSQYERVKNTVVLSYVLSPSSGGSLDISILGL